MIVNCERARETRENVGCNYVIYENILLLSFAHVFTKKLFASNYVVNRELEGLFGCRRRKKCNRFLEIGIQ